MITTQEKPLTLQSLTRKEELITIIENGVMTKDLAAIAEPKPTGYALAEEFIDLV